MLSLSICSLVCESFHWMQIVLIWLHEWTELVLFIWLRRWWNRWSSQNRTNWWKPMRCVKSVEVSAQLCWSVNIHVNRLIMVLSLYLLLIKQCIYYKRCLIIDNLEIIVAIDLSTGVKKDRFIRLWSVCVCVCVCVKY